MTRRTALKSAAAAIAATAAPQLSAQTTGLPPWTQQLSPAIMQGLATAAKTLHDHATAGQATSADIRGVRISLKIYFDHLADIGALPEIRDRVPAQLDTPPTQTALSRIQAAAAAQAVAFTDADLSTFRLTYQQHAQQLKTTIEQDGLEHLHRQILEALDERADRADHTTGGMLALNRVPLKTVQYGNACIEVGIAGIYYTVLQCPWASYAATMAMLLSAEVAWAVGLALVVIAVWVC